MDDPSLQLRGTTLEVYLALCSLRSGQVGAVLEQLDTKHRTLAYTTVQTVLNRLVDKGLADTTRSGKALVYRPLVPASRVRRARVKELIDDLYPGDAGALVLQLVRTRSLSADDLDELKALVAKHEKRRKPRE